MISAMLGFLFYKSPNLSFEKKEIAFFEQLYGEALLNKEPITDTGRYMKYRFIHYIASTKPVVVHGSNNKQIEKFEPRRQTLYNGRYTEAVFGTKDGIWPQFYAVFDRNKLVGDFRNACLKVDKGKSYYFFSLNAQTHASNPWTSGAVYFFPDETFEPASTSQVHFDEWISKTPVKPLLSIHIEPGDFPFINKISTHKPDEKIMTTWLLYKIRTAKN
ncbi:hypothetical protein A8F94_15755 [Bacillus sp. FJAT-27225]|nr:hypothetical protein A8F94_15755 [Bacillus sp. FJAT-27225]